MDIIEINEEFKKAGPLLISKIDGSQKKALINYLSAVGKEQELTKMPEVLEYVYNRFEIESKNNEKLTLSLYLNLKMTAKHSEKYKAGMKNEIKMYKNFETLYQYSRHYALVKKAGSRINDQKSYDTNSIEYQRLVYQTMKQEACSIFKLDIDRNPWIFNQNLLKNKYNGKETLKQLCLTYYIDAEVLFLIKV